MILSIIIPVYNVERYIEGTLNSIYSQEVDEQQFEVIVIDDGTPDDSIAIVERYATKYTNISIIHQTNQGLSCARNAGLNIAKGDYIWFVDSDDQLSKDGINQVIESIENTPVDIIGFNMIAQKEDTGETSVQRIIYPKFYDMYAKVFDCYDILYKAHNWPIQRFVFKRSFVAEYGLSFYPGIIHEDNEFMARAYFLAKSIVFKDIAPYRYLIRTSGSIMSSLNMKSVYSKRIIIDSIVEFSNLHCRSFRQRVYMNAILLEHAFSLLNYKYNTPEYINYIKAQIHILRKLAWNGIIANIYWGSAPKIVKGLVLLIKPLWYKKMMEIYTNRKNKKV